MFSHTFGIEIEMTGLTRSKAARTIAAYFRTTAPSCGGHHLDERCIHDRQGRTWKVVSDSSINARKKVSGILTSATESYKVELVSPPLTYREDIEDLQELIRQLRHAGAIAPNDSSCGIHIHLDGAPHTPRSLQNFIRIIAAKEDLLYDALRFNPARQHWCRKTNQDMLRRLKGKNPRTINQLKAIWYGDSRMHTSHYDSARYTFLNLHSFFQSPYRTVELRGFNSGDEKGKLHAGLIRSYIVLAMALNHQALTQTRASARKTQMDNPKFAMRTYLNRISLSGDEFKNCREHLVKHLSGNAAWRNGRVA